MVLKRQVSRTRSLYCRIIIWFIWCSIWSWVIIPKLEGETFPFYCPEYQIVLLEKLEFLS